MMTKFCESIHGDNWMITDLGKLWPQFNGHGPGFSWQVGSCWSSIYLSTSAVQYLQGTFSWGQISKWRSSESRKCDPGQPLGHSRRRNEQVSWCLSLEPCSPTHEQPTFVHFTFNLEMTELRGMLMFNMCSLIGSRHTAHAFSRPPPDWFEISWCIHSWHPLCPHNKDTGLFISSLLKNRMRFHQQKIRELILQLSIHVKIYKHTTGIRSRLGWHLAYAPQRGPTHKCKKPKHERKRWLP